jgi:FkbH-like protein
VDELNSGSLRTSIDAAISAQDFPQARRLLSELWRSSAGPSLARFITSRYDQIADALGFKSHTSAIQRSFTVEPIVPLLRAVCFEHGIRVDVHVGDFNTYTQDILIPGGPLYGAGADSVILAVQTRDFAPELWRDAAAMSDEDIDAAVTRAIADFRELVASFRAKSNANLILHSLEEPARPSRGILDAQGVNGQRQAVRRINAELSAIAHEVPGVYVLDYDALVARHGREAWHDEERWLKVRLPIAASHLIDMAEEWAHFLLPLAGRMSKCLVVDLDNTLWGGVVGEEGVTGIALGPESPGAAFQELQRAVLELYERGIVIAIASKNNFADAMEVLEGHDGMVLKPDHFAALRINWNNKAQSLREIAEELNIGIDSLAFLDDNPVEREWIRRELPEVTVIDLTGDPFSYARSLRACPVFERLSLSEEDRERSRYYAADRLRNDLAQNVTSLEDFYRSLDMQMDVAYCAPDSLQRIAQLTQKTNQFNLTTRRYTEQQIRELNADPNSRVYSFRVRDRFGDNGLIAVVITHQDGATCELDTFLMSCRVMGRTVETAILASVADDARTRGATRLTGWYIPTSKNGMVSELYANHGFSCAAQTDMGTFWEIDLDATPLEVPAWIARNVAYQAAAV